MKIKKAILIFASSMVLFYLIGAFISWEFNPGKWTQVSRITYGIMGTVISAILALVYCNWDEIQ